MSFDETAAAVGKSGRKQFRTDPPCICASAGRFCPLSVFTVRLTSDFERNIMSKLKDLGVFLLIVLLYIAVMSITGIGCPIRWFTGISCPGCGMSRAFFSLLHLDFAGAFRYHPLIYPVILFVPYYFLGSEKTDRQKKVKKTLLILLAILAICLWIFRIFHEDSVVRIDLSNSVMIKYLKQMKGVLKCT